MSVSALAQASSPADVLAATITGPTQANPVVAAATAAPDWNALAVGQTVNGGKVLDATEFQKDYLSQLAAGGASYTQDNGDAGTSTFSLAGGSVNSGSVAKALGNDLSSTANISLLGFTPQSFVTQGASGYGANGGTGAAATYDDDAIKAAAKSAGIDISKYTSTSAPTTVHNDQDNYDTITPGSSTLDYVGLTNAINSKAFQQAAANPNALFAVDSQKVGDDSHLSRNNTVYVQRGDRLVPVTSNDYKDASEFDQAAKGIAFVATSVLGAAAAPALSAYFGGGILGAAGSGATLGGVNSALNGQNVLKGALEGGVLGGIGSGVSSGVSSLTGSTQLGNIASGIAKAGTGDIINGKSGGIGIDALLGGLGGAQLTGNQFLDTILKQGIGTAVRKQG